MATVFDKFPEDLYVTFEEEESYEGGGFLSTAKTIDEAVTSTKRQQVAVYKRVRIEEWKMAPEHLANIG